MTDLQHVETAISAFESPTFGHDGSFDVDKPVGSASISPCGRDIVLASRQGLHIIDLDSPWSPPRHLPHRTPWEVADVQWSPFAVRDYWVVSTSNQKALVWNLGMKDPKVSIEHILHAHTRAVTDINFSAHHPDVLATCAVDSFVHCWDLRNPARPAMTFCDWFAGATQVKWNRQDGHILASSHDKYLRIWDDRKGAYPLRSIEAHATKIYGVDWDRTSVNNVVTCSLDKSIKFWDFASDADVPTRTIHTPYPVWRARTTPFGWGLLAMPQRGEFDLYLYDRRIGEEIPQEATPPPIHRFEGHQDQVKEFLWRPRGTIDDGIDNRDFQLVSWGADHKLRLHRLDEDLLRDIGYERGKRASGNINISRRNAPYKTFREDPSTPKPDEDHQTPSLLDHTHLASYSALSAGMRKPRSTTLGGWRDTRFTNATMGTRSRAAAQNDNDALLWMKGVKIGRRDLHPASLQRSAASILSLGPKVDGAWDTFESLGEEISHVGGNFAKVTLTEIDMLKRSLIASMSGPWGSSKTPTYIRCHFNFPSSYPDSAAPMVILEKTASISIEVLATLTAEISSLSNMYAAHGRSSFESILRYLLGEETLEECTAWLKQPLISNDQDLFNDAAESSTDEDEAGTTAQMDMSGSGLVASNANFNVPLPKACGAVWADDGRLVCFFPIREGNPQSLLGSLELTSGGRSHKYDDSVFEGFGRFRTNLPSSKKPLPTSMNDEEGSGSESSFESSSGSSSSEGTNLRYQNYYSLVPLRDDTITGPRSHTAEDSHPSNIGTANTKATATSKNTISICDFREILPAKKALAQRYSVTGPPSECCRRNAKTAQDFGDHDLADIWSFIALLLRDEVPLDMIPHPYKEESVLIMARHALAPLRAKDSGVYMSTDFLNEVQLKKPRGSIRWGQHPFGRNMLVDRIFRYFEQRADVQMLGILSCILSESGIARELVKPISTAVAEKVEHSDRAMLGYPFGGISLLSDRGIRSSLDYFASAEVAKTVLQPKRSTIQAPENRRGTSTNANSAASSIGTTKSDTATPWSGNTPPTLYKSSRTSFERPASLTAGLSVSPELNRFAHRSNSTLASTANTPASRSFFSNSSVSSSPPTTFPKKRISPSGSYAGILAPKATRSAVSILARSLTISEDPKMGHTTSGSETEEDILLHKQPVIKINLKNQDRFHNDSHATVSLLDPQKEWQYRAYREAYAHLLFVWELPMIRGEILKFNHFSSSTLSSMLHRAPTHDTAASLFTIGTLTTQLYPRNTADTCVDIRPNCITCTKALPPSSSTCKLCKIKRPLLICLYCAEVIHGLGSPCLACGHVLHSSCRNLVLAVPEIGEECISGCACRCKERAILEVEMANEAELVKEVFPGVEGGNEQEQARSSERDVAYESLARNLGRSGEGVKRKGSVVWRGG